ncbi:hypothetical protein ACFO0N_03220 [Halobium salinum]|uniref:Uncharacterized protein n=1 Tax=Halobium salinum TaxID=1364940 RepID=A0ABD5P880_9EURY|nr:hypothetical protein [Halobium salinum]
METTNVTPSTRPTERLLDGPAERVVPPRSVGTDGDAHVFAGFLKFADGDDTCWLRRSITVVPTLTRGSRLDLTVEEAYRDAGVGRIVPLTSYADSCAWDGDGSFEGVQRAVTAWHDTHRTLGPGVFEK